MGLFYFFIWLRWFVRLTIESLVFASLFAFIVTLSLFFTQGEQSLNKEVLEALLTIFLFWFAPFWSVSILLALFRSIKYIFNICNNGYMFVLYGCEKQQTTTRIEFIGYGDLVKVWRRWFMLLIWLVASEMILVTFFASLFFDALFAWFSIYTLYGFIAFGVYFSFIILGARCKQVKIQKC